jgi:hypothetical protein
MRAFLSSALYAALWLLLVIPVTTVAASAAPATSTAKHLNNSGTAIGIGVRSTS